MKSPTHTLARRIFGLWYLRSNTTMTAAIMTMMIKQSSNCQLHRHEVTERISLRPSSIHYNPRFFLQLSIYFLCQYFDNFMSKSSTTLVQGQCKRFPNAIHKVDFGWRAACSTEPRPGQFFGKTLHLYTASLYPGEYEHQQGRILF